MVLICLILVWVWFSDDLMGSFIFICILELFEVGVNFVLISGNSINLFVKVVVVMVSVVLC